MNTGIGKLLERRLGGQLAGGLKGPDARLMGAQRRVWDTLCDHYFRLEVDGWDRLPDRASLLVGVHSGGSLTMDAWTLTYAWWRHFGGQRVLNGTAHDVLMAAPVLGDYFRLSGVIPASRAGVSAALETGHDVIVWPGGDRDAMRSWRKRDTAVLAGRAGFVKQAIRSGVPIVPVATVGGHDTVFVLSEGQFLARWSGLGRRLRGANAPVVLGLPFGLTVELLPTHLPLPAKIRTELLDPIDPGTDPERADDRGHVEAVYREVESAIQAGMDRLAARRKLPVFG